MIPYNQGYLDGLCGIYSIINSARVVNNFNKKYCQTLFEDILRFLVLESCLFKILTNGITMNMIGQIINTHENLNLMKKRPFHGQHTTNLNEFWCSMQNHLASPNRAIILGLGGVYDHWTVVNEISDKRIMLVDSTNLKYLNKSFCTTRDDENVRHRISPKYTYYLWSRDDLE